MMGECLGCFSHHGRGASQRRLFHGRGAYQRQQQYPPPRLLHSRSYRQPHLMAPDGGEDVVQLDVDGGEGQEAGHEHLRYSGAVPRQGRDFTRELSRPVAEGGGEGRRHVGGSVPQEHERWWKGGPIRALRGGVSLHDPPPPPQTQDCSSDFSGVTGRGRG